jgi:negative regulator of replication initiation
MPRPETRTLIGKLNIRTSHRELLMTLMPQKFGRFTEALQIGSVVYFASNQGFLLWGDVAFI